MRLKAPLEEELKRFCNSGTEAECSALSARSSAGIIALKAATACLASLETLS